MDIALKIQSALARVKDQSSFIQRLLVDALQWPVDENAEKLDDISFEWTPDELRAADLDKSLMDGGIWQLQSMKGKDDQPWGVFLLQFKNKDLFARGRGMTGTLRKVLRGLVPLRRDSLNSAHRKTWQRENLLFICTHDYTQFRFAYFKKPLDESRQAPIVNFGWNHGDTHLRTLCEYNLPALLFPADLGRDSEAWLSSWRSAFDVEKVTKQFFLEISDWYFWARDDQNVGLPSNLKSDEDRALFLIRLLTRLIFCWFLRKKINPDTDKGLLPDELFTDDGIRGLLKDASTEVCTYYTAILQNLFFATLNTEMDKPKGASNRRFVDEGDGRRSDDHMIHTVWRHQKLLRSPIAFEKLLRSVPFLNGGLFECLDRRDQKGNSTQEVRIDGFSEDRQKQPKLPNYLFFGDERPADLSDAYGDSSRKRATVRPLLSILNRYNFTLTENTPLAQDVALDPELLGHVFENLLAAYNPETGTVARKATGSFYTPRVVVDWMVDQALLSHFEKALQSGKAVAGKPKEDPRLGQLLSWDDEKTPSFNSAETETLIDSIDSLKVIDPACGSGAFPMGMLQKLVHVLRKLDPKNKGWRRRQEAAVSKIESSPAMEQAKLAIERAFARDNDDYGRKLYLIENCLYGVDIQPIACQIAKLRFFISLIVDQTIDPKEPNYGILPLPNLETKIVAANALLGLKRGQLLLTGEDVRNLEAELRQVRHDYFTARRYKDKMSLRKRDKELCEALADELSSMGALASQDSKRLVEWNPYDTNVAASFFDTEWMFGLQDGFDIVVGNPPYVRQEELKNITVTGGRGKTTLKDALKELYDCYTGTADLFVYFFERSFQLLKIGGVLSFVTSNK